MDGKYNFTFNFLTIPSSYHCKYSTKIINRMAWAFYCTHSTAQAQLLVDHRMIINDADSTCGTRLLTDSAAYTAYFTLFFSLNSFTFIRTFDYNIIGTFMNMDNFLRTDFHTFSTGNAFIFIDFRNTIFIQGNCAKLTYTDAGSTANAAICTSLFPLCRPASTITCYKGCSVWKSFFYCHINPSFRMVYPQVAD